MSVPTISEDLAAARRNLLNAIDRASYAGDHTLANALTHVLATLQDIDLERSTP